MNLPNRLTLLRVLLVPVFVALALVPSVLAQLLATVCFALASLTDLLDGYIARRYNLVTDFGRLMDPMADKLLVLAALLVLLHRGSAPLIAVLIILAREFVIMSIRMVALSKGSVIAADWLGKIKTVMQLVAILLLLFAPVIPRGAEWAAVHISFQELLLRAGELVLWGSALLSICSCISYIVRNREAIGT